MFSKKNPKELQEIQNKRWNSLQPIQTKIETKSMEYKPSDIDSYNISEKKKEIKNHTFKLKKDQSIPKKEENEYKEMIELYNSKTQIQKQENIEDEFQSISTELSNRDIHEYIQQLHQKPPYEESVLPSVYHKNTKNQKVPYYYLVECSEIRMDFSPKDMNLLGKNIEIQLCLFNIQKNISFLPYLTFIQEIHQTSIEECFFPTIEYQVPNMTEETDIQQLFHNCCLEKIYEIFSFLPNEKTTPKQLQKLAVYKGFILDGAKLLVLYDVSKSKQSISKESSKSYIWATIHELVNSNKIKNIAVKENVSEWFLNYSDLLYLKDIHRNPIDIPYVLYSLTKMDISKKQTEKKSEYKTVVYSTYSSSYSSLHTIQIIPEEMDHPMYGPSFYFSNYIWNEEDYKNINTIERYVAFPVNTLYILNINQTKDKDAIESCQSIYFQEQGKPIWCIKTIDYFAILG